MASSSLPLQVPTPSIAATLPPELNDLIFRHLGNDRVSLGHCTQVSRIWMECAYTYAFNKITIKVCVEGRRTLSDFVAFLQRSGARFAPCVSGLDVAASSDDRRASQAALEITLLKRALHLLPNISNLKIAVHSIDHSGSLGLNITDEPALSHTTSIKTLDICLDQLGGIKEQWRSLIKLFVEIERLVVHTTHTGELRRDEDLDMVRDLRLNPPREWLKLQHLEFIVRQPSATQLNAHILCNVLRAIIIPALTYCPAPAEFRSDDDYDSCILTLIGHIGEGLKEFSFSRDYRRTLPLGTSYLRRCPQLVTFNLPDQICEIPADTTPVPGAHTSNIGPTFLQFQLPDSLKTLRLHELTLRRFVDHTTEDDVPQDAQSLERALQAYPWELWARVLELHPHVDVWEVYIKYTISHDGSVQPEISGDAVRQTVLGRLPSHIREKTKIFLNGVAPIN